MRTVELAGGIVHMINQKALPLQVEILDLRTAGEVAAAIRDLTVRGAPAIGVAAAFGLVLAADELAARHGGSAASGSAAGAAARGSFRAATAASAEPGSAIAGDAYWHDLEAAHQLLRSTRPTAVNLFWALDRMMAVAADRRESGASASQLAAALREEAERMAAEDVETNRRIGAFGQALLRDGDGVLTHCNAGALATVDYGTALGVLRAAHEAGKRLHIYIDETRPILQGARLTAWEAVQAGWDATLITDNMAGHFMRLGKVQAAIVGADRIAANGDVANKIGTYSMAVLCHEHGIPFYVAAPISTLDLRLASGDQIVIEERKAEEVTGYGGIRWAPEGIRVANPAFDVTPWRYVTGIITERGIARPPYNQTLRELAQPG